MIKSKMMVKVAQMGQYY